MPEPYDNTWIDLFQTLPDPRHRRGCRFPWWVLLTIIMMALASNQHHPKAMSEWSFVDTLFCVEGGLHCLISAKAW